MRNQSRQPHCVFIVMANPKARLIRCFLNINETVGGTATSLDLSSHASRRKTDCRTRREVFRSQSHCGGWTSRRPAQAGSLCGYFAVRNRIGGASSWLAVRREIGGLHAGGDLDASEQVPEKMR